MINQLAKKFPGLCGTWRFISVVRTARHLLLSWVTWIHSTMSYPISLRLDLIVS